MNPAETEANAVPTPESEQALAKKSLDEIQLALDVEGTKDFDFDTEARYVITDTGVPNDEKVRELIQADPTLGFEVVKMDGLPQVTRVVDGKELTFYQYKDQLIHSHIQALFVDRSQPAMSGEGATATNYKGMRKGEVITPDVIKQRFGKELSYSVSISDEGKLEVTNPDSEKKVTVLGFGDAKIAGEATSQGSALEVATPAVPAEAAAVAEVIPSDDDFSKAVEAGKLATALEAEIDQESLEIAAEISPKAGEQLDTEDIKKIGDEGLEAAEVHRPDVAEEVPTPAESITAESTEAVETDTPVNAEALSVEEPTVEDERPAVDEAAIYTQYENGVMDIRFEAAGELAKIINRLEENENVGTVGNRTVVEAASTTLSQLNGMLRHAEDYPVGAFQTVLRQTIDGLYAVHGATRRFGEGTLGEIRTAASAIEEALASQSRDADAKDNDFQVVLQERGLTPSEGLATAGDALKTATDTISGVQELRTSLNALDGTMGELASRSLRGPIDQLEDILRNSYSRPIDTSELYEISRGITQAFESDDVRNGINDVTAKLQAVIGQVRQARAGLTPA